MDKFYMVRKYQYIQIKYANMFIFFFHIGINIVWSPTK